MRHITLTASPNTGKVVVLFQNFARTRSKFYSPTAASLRRLTDLIYKMVVARAGEMRPCVNFAGWHFSSPRRPMLRRMTPLEYQPYLPRLGRPRKSRLARRVM